MTSSRITLTFLFLATCTPFLTEQEHQTIQDASHPLLQPLGLLEFSFESSCKAVVERILEPFNIALPETWQNDQELLSFGLDHQKVLKLIEEDAPANFYEVVQANMAEGFSNQAFEALREANDPAAIKSQVTQNLDLFRGTLMAALRSDIAEQIGFHDFRATSIEFKINKNLLTMNLEALMYRFKELSQFLKVDLAQEYKKFNEDLNADLKEFAADYMPRVMEIVALWSDPSRFLVAEMVRLVAHVGRDDHATQNDLVTRISHHLAPLTAKFDKSSKQAEQFVTFCIKMFRSSKGDEQYQHFLTRAAIAVFQEVYLGDQTRDLCLLPLFGSLSEPIPSMSNEIVAFFNNFFDKYGRIHTEMQDTWTNIKIAEGCAGAFLAHDHGEIKKALARFSTFQQHRSQWLEMFARTSVLLVTDLLPIEAEGDAPNLQKIIHAVMYRGEHIASDEGNPAGDLPWFETEINGDTIDHKLDIAHAQGTLGLIDYVVGKMLNAFTSAALRETPFVIRINPAFDEDNLPSLIGYLTANTKLASLMHKVAADRVKKLNLDVTYESPADVFDFLSTQQFTSDDFNFGEAKHESKKFFVSAEPSVAPELTVSVTNQDLNEEFSSETFPDLNENSAIKYPSIEEIQDEEATQKKLDRALSIGGPLGLDPIMESEVEFFRDEEEFEE